MTEELLPTKGFYLSTLDWVKNTGNEECLFEIYPELKIPDVSRVQEHKILVGKPEYSNKALVTILQGGRVWLDRAVISPDNKLLYDLSYEWMASPEEHSIFKEEKLPPVTMTDETVAMLNHPAGYNYFHSVPNENFHFKAKQLVVPSYVNLPNAWSCKYVRNLLFNRVKITKNKEYERIYIKRANRRKITNEKEILGTLRKYGFKAVSLESMSLEKQMEVFYSAEIVIGAHGAGLTNLVFCRPGTRVIELFAPTYIEPHYC